ncbi:MAG: hypothetical protein DRG82_00460 [Deltaproteobacteria bacterium]|nr:MAG: hypothetical protein DRG82_00460 [Deltaproteobacteria bacterium]
MIHLEDSSFKRFCLWFLIGLCFLLAGYLFLVLSLSILIGIRAVPQPGSWVPIFSGSVCLIPVLWALIRITKLLLAQMAEEDIVNV